ncbi:MAG: NifX-associated nitrogen fixation protein [Pseudomonadota bacterium]
MSDFTKALLTMLRAQDRSGAWDSEPDEVLLAPFIVTKAQKRELPMIGDPDPDILWRVELYYQAVAWLVENRSGIACAPMMNIHHEGWGRVVIIAGRLVALNSHVRELHRFGFESVEEMERKALKLVDEATAAIARFPETAAA